MQAQDHPEFHIEEEHLSSTVTALEAKLKSMETRDYQGGDDHARNKLIDLAEEEYDRLCQSCSAPYFGRIDFTVDDQDERRAYYLGKAGFEQDTCMVIDWRAPISHLFYQYARPGKASYESPDGLIAGTLSLKRIFEIKAQRLQTITDQFDARKELPKGRLLVTDPDQYLQQVLQKRQDIQLRDIVATIQQEQDRLIRADAQQVLVIQGVAGSGKTSIALHRLAFLLYPGATTGIKASRCIVFGPNRFFLNHISLVLPSLGIKDIPQVPLTEWELEQLALRERQTTDKTLDTIMSAASTRESKVAEFTACRLKSSRAMARLLERYIEQRRQVTFPETGLTFQDIGKFPVTLALTQAQLTEIFQQGVTLPLEQHRERFVQSCLDRLRRQYEEAITQRMHEQAAPGEELVARARQIKEKVEEMDKLADAVIELEDEGLTERKVADSLWQGATGLRDLAEYYERKGNLIVLSAENQREQALTQEVKKSAFDQLERSVRREIERIWHPLVLPDDYYALIGDSAQLGRLAEGLFKPDQVRLLSQSSSDSQAIDLSDLPALFFLHTAARGVPAGLFDHIVIDEAQDISPLEFEALSRYSRNGSITILGDIAQSIYPHRGLAHWDEIQPVFSKWRYSPNEITKSYRSTFEIMGLAKRALLSVPRKGRPVALPDPLKRHGLPPQLHHVRSEVDFPIMIRRVVEQLEEDGYRNIAIICKTGTHCSALIDLLKNSGWTGFQSAMSPEFVYKGGVVVVPVHLAKGMEFEASLVVGVDAKTYSDTEFDGRLLYVALTRALHVLHLIWAGRLSMHLENAVQKHGE